MEKYYCEKTDDGIDVKCMYCAEVGVWFDEENQAMSCDKCGKSWTLGEYLAIRWQNTVCRRLGLTYGGQTIKKHFEEAGKEWVGPSKLPLLFQQRNAEEDAR